MYIDVGDDPVISVIMNGDDEARRRLDTFKSFVQLVHL